MKKLLTVLLALLMVVGLAACGSKDEPTVEGENGSVFRIMAWNEEFKGFFEKYYTVPEGVTVEWVIVPNEGTQYQDAVDLALANQDPAKPVDMMLAEADYILKYVNSPVTADVTKLGVTDFSNCYKYTVEACTDTNGVIKGVSFQCCPSGMVYRRSVAKEVLGTDDPAEVQAQVDTWEKFDAVAEKAKALGYYMTPSYAETYRLFSNNVTSPWVDANGNLQIDDQIKAWMKQAETYVEKGYTTTYGIWDAGKNEVSMYTPSQSFCLFGPAWYFNFCMGPAWEESLGDWGLCEGPAAHFWGGTWLLACEGTDNAEMVADVMNTFINNEEVCKNLVVNEAQFCNNIKVNDELAKDDVLGANELLGGQNATAIFADLAKNIKFQNQTIYDQACNENISTYLCEFLTGAVESEEAALNNFYLSINEKYPNVKTPQ